MVLTDFDLFWQAYPRKTAKPKARVAFDKAARKANIDVMLSALAWQRKTEQWMRGIIPHPATWLNQERWDDEPSTGQKDHRSDKLSGLREFIDG